MIIANADMVIRSKIHTVCPRSHVSFNVISYYKCDVIFTTENSASKVKTVSTDDDIWNHFYMVKLPLLFDYDHIFLKMF